MEINLKSETAYSSAGMTLGALQVQVFYPVLLQINMFLHGHPKLHGDLSQVQRRMRQDKLLFELMPLFASYPKLSQVFYFMHTISYTKHEPCLRLFCQLYQS